MTDNISPTDANSLKPEKDKHKDFLKEMILISYS